MTYAFYTHQPMHWADTEGLKNDLKQSLFQAYFSEGQDVSDRQVLIARAVSVGLDKTERPRYSTTSVSWHCQ